MEHILKVKGPYHFKNALTRLSMDPLLNLSPEKEWLQVPLWLDNTPCVIEVRQIGTVEHPEFIISCEEDPPEDELFQQLRHLFHWNVPLEKVASSFAASELSAIAAYFRGTPFVCDFQLYGTLMKTIIHQQLNMSFAYTLTSRFVQSFGFQKQGAWFYPHPEKIAALQTSDLRALQFSSRKAEYVIDTSKLIVTGKLDLEGMCKASDAEIREELMNIRGVGRWTAENFMMFGLGRTDLFPVQDAGLQNAVKKLKKLEEKPSQEDLTAMSVDWAPYRTYASLYLWESLQVSYD